MRRRTGRPPWTRVGRTAPTDRCAYLPEEIMMLVADGAPLTAEELARLDAHWRAANYLSVGQIYLMGNPLLREPLRPEHVKPRLLGHWGTSPGLNLVYAHMNRLIRRDRFPAIYLAGPGHGGPAVVACTYLE